MCDTLALLFVSRSSAWLKMSMPFPKLGSLTPGCLYTVKVVWTLGSECVCAFPSRSTFEMGTGPGCPSSPPTSSAVSRVKATSDMAPIPGRTPDRGDSPPEKPGIAMADDACSVDIAGMFISHPVTRNLTFHCAYTAWSRSSGVAGRPKRADVNHGQRECFGDGQIQLGVGHIQSTASSIVAANTQTVSLQLHAHGI